MPTTSITRTDAQGKPYTITYNLPPTPYSVSYKAPTPSPETLKSSSSSTPKVYTLPDGTKTTNQAAYENAMALAAKSGTPTTTTPTPTTTAPSIESFLPSQPTSQSLGTGKSVGTTTPTPTLSKTPTAPIESFLPPQQGVSESLSTGKSSWGAPTITPTSAPSISDMTPIVDRLVPGGTISDKGFIESKQQESLKIAQEGQEVETLIGIKSGSEELKKLQEEAEKRAGKTIGEATKELTTQAEAVKRREGYLQTAEDLYRNAPTEENWQSYQEAYSKARSSYDYYQAQYGTFQTIFGGLVTKSEEFQSKYKDALGTLPGQFSQMQLESEKLEKERQGVVASQDSFVNKAISKLSLGLYSPSEKLAEQYSEDIKKFQENYKPELYVFSEKPKAEETYGTTEFDKRQIQLIREGKSPYLGIVENWLTPKAGSAERVYQTLVKPQIETQKARAQALEESKLAATPEERVLYNIKSMALGSKEGLYTVGAWAPEIGAGVITLGVGIPLALSAAEFLGVPTAVTAATSKVITWGMIAGTGAYVGGGAFTEDPFGEVSKRATETAVIIGATAGSQAAWKSGMEYTFPRTVKWTPFELQSETTEVAYSGKERITLVSKQVLAGEGQPGRGFRFNKDTFFKSSEKPIKVETTLKTSRVPETPEGAPITQSQYGTFETEIKIPTTQKQTLKQRIKGEAPKTTVNTISKKGFIATLIEPGMLPPIEGIYPDVAMTLPVEKGQKVPTSRAISKATVAEGEEFISTKATSLAQQYRSESVTGQKTRVTFGSSQTYPSIIEKPGVQSEAFVSYGERMEIAPYAKVKLGKAGLDIYRTDFGYIDQTSALPQIADIVATQKPVKVYKGILKEQELYSLSKGQTTETYVTGIGKIVPTMDVTYLEGYQLVAKQPVTIKRPRTSIWKSKKAGVYGGISVGETVSITQEVGTMQEPTYSMGKMAGELSSFSAMSESIGASISRMATPEISYVRPIPLVVSRQPESISKLRQIQEPQTIQQIQQIQQPQLIQKLATIGETQQIQQIQEPQTIQEIQQIQDIQQIQKIQQIQQIQTITSQDIVVPKIPTFPTPTTFPELNLDLTEGKGLARRTREPRQYQYVPDLIALVLGQTTRRKPVKGKLYGGEERRLIYNPVTGKRKKKSRRTNRPKKQTNWLNIRRAF